jgi:hypothetical protein
VTVSAERSERHAHACLLPRQEVERGRAVLAARDEEYQRRKVEVEAEAQAHARAQAEAEAAAAEESTKTSAPAGTQQLPLDSGEEAAPWASAEGASGAAVAPTPVGPTPMEEEEGEGAESAATEMIEREGGAGIPATASAGIGGGGDGAEVAGGEECTMVQRAAGEEMVMTSEKELPAGPMESDVVSVGA